MRCLLCSSRLISIAVMHSLWVVNFRRVLLCRVMHDFRSGRSTVLVSTSVLARGVHMLMVRLQSSLALFASLLEYA